MSEEKSLVERAKEWIEELKGDKPYRDTDEIAAILHELCKEVLRAQYGKLTKDKAIEVEAAWMELSKEYSKLEGRLQKGEPLYVEVDGELRELRCTTIRVGMQVQWRENTKKLFKKYTIIEKGGTTHKYTYIYRPDDWYGIIHFHKGRWCCKAVNSPSRCKSEVSGKPRPCDFVFRSDEEWEDGKV